MRSMIAVLAIAGALGAVSAPAANAFPLVGGAVTVDNSDVTNVGYFCGPGRHIYWGPGAWHGRCVPNGPGPIWHPWHRWHRWHW